MIKLKMKYTAKKAVGLCPFHKEKTPSFTMDFIKKTYHCFGCKRKGKLEELAKEGYSLEWEILGH